MMIDAVQINIPYSGEYEEIIYDISSSWNSQKWSWLKFTNDVYHEWCAEFRGEYRGHGISQRYKVLLVLTSDYLFKINLENGELIDYVERPDYTNLTVTPEGDFIVSDYYGISVIYDDIHDDQVITLPLHLDMIKFIEWSGASLRFEGVEVMNWDNRVKLEFNCMDMSITILDQSNPGIL